MHLISTLIYQISREKLISLITLLTYLSISSVSGQILNKSFVGIGAGLDYGGFGIRCTYKPINKLGVFGAVGYNLNDLGYNLGAQYIIHDERKISIYATIMYGYNTVLIVQGITESKTTYFGPSLGSGVNYTFSKSGKSFVSLELLFPIRPSSYQNAVDALESLGYDIKDQQSILVSIGYHFKIFTKK